MLLKGRVKSGEGNFSYWIQKLNSYYSAKTGMKLFPGTLNILLEDVMYEFPQQTIRLEKEEYGGTVSVAILPCQIMGRPAFVLRPDSHGGAYGYPKEAILEIATDIKLRDHFGFVDEDWVEVELPDDGKLLPLRNTKKPGPDFYDEAGVFDIYYSHHGTSDSPNETIEQPILWEMIGDPKRMTVLDLGCGDGRVAQKFHALGAQNYLGVEGSRRMVEKAESRVIPGFSRVEHSWIESYEPPAATFDLVSSSLALHYVENLKSVFQKVYKALKQNGRLVFSVEHPVITSCNKALENSSVRESWIVDDYFMRGPRQIQWMGSTVTIYHRTVEDFLNLLKQVGFKDIQLRESDPPQNHFEDQNTLSRRRRIPLFLFLSATKP